jgi:hypothetical protein
MVMLTGGGTVKKYSLVGEHWGVPLSKGIKAVL